MAFYDLSKEERTQLVRTIHETILEGLGKKDDGVFLHYFEDEDTYVRKAAYQAIGRIYLSHNLAQPAILGSLKRLLASPNEKVRQTVVNAAGEIGMQQFEIVQAFFDTALFDSHHSVRNAVIGSIKKMGQKNPNPTLLWAKKHLHHEDKEIRREICHGLELRGRTHPGDILPLLKELQYDDTPRVKNTLIHVLGQIAYKKGCLEEVVFHLKSWSNKEIVEKALDEIIDVHQRYAKFSHLSQQEAIAFIDNTFKPPIP